MHNYDDTQVKELVIAPTSPETRWVTIGEDDAIVSEGKTPQEAIEKADKLTANYTLMYVPQEGSSCFY